MTVHNFSESLQVGERYEAVLDAHFSQWFEVEPVTKGLQRLGIDRIFIKGTGERFTVEYKTDLQTDKTGYAFIETVSVRDKKQNEIKKLGWAYTSTAQMLIYYVPGLGTAFIVDMLKLRDKIEGWVRNHKTVSSDNGDYVGEGVLVPATKLRKLARGITRVELSDETG